MNHFLYVFSEKERDTGIVLAGNNTGIGRYEIA